MEYVKVILIIFRGDKGTKQREEQFAKWEIAAYDWSLKQYRSPLIELQVVGTEILDMEMIRDGRRMTPFFAAEYNEFNLLILSLVGIGATLCPIVAITSTYGIISAMGCRVNSFMLVMPFLIMGIGVE
uniref:SSD domain-containing protein n=1 Tax=Heterorhabditis bacteriophora TaxID=37862 RepID=A0A1I7WSY7_HETBA